MQGCKEFFIRASNLKAGGYIARFPYRKLMKGVHGLHCLQYQKVILHYVLHASCFALVSANRTANFQQRLSVVLAFKIGSAPET